MTPTEGADFFQTYTSSDTPSKEMRKPVGPVLPIAPIAQKNSGKLGIVLDAIFDLSKLFFDFLLKLTSTLLKGFKYICWGFFGLSISVSILLVTCIGGIYAL